MDKCFDEGTLQTFLDGELSAVEAQRVARHLAVCDACALLLADAEEETAFVFEALDQELNSLVPTQRLWSKINETIETQNRSRSWREKAAAFFSGISLLNPQVMAFGGLLIMVGIVSAVILIPKNGVPDQSIASNQTATTQTTPEIAKTGEPDKFIASGPEGLIEPVEASSPKSRPAFRAERASYSEAPKRIVTKAPRAIEPVQRIAYLDGEESFVNTISRLEKTVNENKDQVLKPSARFSYEKDLAVVDNTISRMKQVVRNNPKNEDAKQILFASYRNKIDLLNSVNQRGEMMASLR